MGIVTAIVCMAMSMSICGKCSHKLEVTTAIYYRVFDVTHVCRLQLMWLCVDDYNTAPSICLWMRMSPCWLIANSSVKSAHSTWTLTVGNMHLQNRDISRISLVICKRPNKINNQLSNPNELRHWPFKRCMPFLSPLFACARLRETKKKLFFETFVYIKCCDCLGPDPAPIPASPYAFIYNVCIYSVRCTRENRQIRSAVRCSFQ